MKHEPETYLYDILEACTRILEFTEKLSLDEYRENALVSSAVERQFVIIGEALTRLRREFPEMIERITDVTKIIGFRNILVHGYDVIDDATVWVIESLFGAKRAANQLALISISR